MGEREIGLEELKVALSFVEDERADHYAIGDDPTTRYKLTDCLSSEKNPHKQENLKLLIEAGIICNDPRGTDQYDLEDSFDVIEEDKKNESEMLPPPPTKVSQSAADNLLSKGAVLNQI